MNRRKNLAEPGSNISETDVNMFLTRSQIIKLINILFIVGDCECHQQNKEHMKIMALISTMKVSPVL